MERDREADAALKRLGWMVIRLWDFEIRRDLDRCVATIEAALTPPSRAA
jgi:DNA mismatch endonuclease (patch repair protein)